MCKYDWSLRLLCEWCSNMNASVSRDDRDCWGWCLHCSSSDFIWSLSLPPSDSVWVAAKVNTVLGVLNHRISQRKTGQGPRTVPVAEQRGVEWGNRPLPPKRFIILAPTGNPNLSEPEFAYSSAHTWHKYLHDTAWHGRSYRKCKLIIAHYKQHSQWPPRQTVAK